ncbi:MAG: hypothetical protein EBS53_12030, partial [Bacteroidetes bacterium]|nr:hypothetical protein [Bacteroidota bacterium]
MFIPKKIPVIKPQAQWDIGEKMYYFVNGRPAPSTISESLGPPAPLSFDDLMFMRRQLHQADIDFARRAEAVRSGSGSGTMPLPAESRVYSKQLEVIDRLIFDNPALDDAEKAAVARARNLNREYSDRISVTRWVETSLRPESILSYRGLGSPP